MEFLSAGIKFKIGNNTLAGCYSTPDMGAEPAKVDVTSFDDLKNKRYIDGLMDVQSLNFDFYDQTDNFAAARSAEANKNNSYEVEYPDGSKYSWQGSHRVFKLAANVGDPIKFRVACTPNGEITPSNGTAVSGNSGS